MPEEHPALPDDGFPAEPALAPAAVAAPPPVQESLAPVPEAPAVLIDIPAEPADLQQAASVESSPEPEAEPGIASVMDETPAEPSVLPQLTLPEFSPLSWSPLVAAEPPAEPASLAEADVEAADRVKDMTESAEADAGETVPTVLADWTDTAPDQEPAGPPIAQTAEAVLDAQPLAEPPADADPADAEPAESPAASSELAGRVVDAMLKTISSAIYAKPTASERAAFLREIATLMELEGNQPSPQLAVPQPAAPQHVIPQVAAPELAAPEPAPPVPGPATQPLPVPVAIEAATPVQHLEAATADDAIGDVLAGRLGPAAALLKSRQESEDPFAEPPKLRLLEEPELTETVEADDETGDLALTLLDMMSGSQGAALPQERTLAADTLLRILPRIPIRQLLAVVERVAIMETPPQLLVAKLIRDSRPEVVAPLLERCSHISDQDLMNAAPASDAVKLRMMARRRVLSQVLSDYLIDSGEPNVVLTLIRNPGAALSHEAFYRLAELAARHHALLAPLATRADLPPPVAFELFWLVPPELRRFIFSRFLTDSETLNRILRITLSTHGESEQAAGDMRFPPREAIDSAIALATAFRLDEAAEAFASLAGIVRDTALRILSDRDGEPLTVLLKALGYPRSGLEDVLSLLRHPDAGLLRLDRKPEDLQTVFDSMSFNKARILLTYWDWFVRKAGPYAPHN